MLTDFVGNIKHQMFIQLWEFKIDTLIINHFIIKYILYGMVTRRSLRWVLWRSTTSLFSHVTLYILLHFKSGTQKSNTNVINLFYMNIQFDKLLSEIDNVFKKKLDLPSQHNRPKCSVFHPTPRNNVTLQRNTMFNSNAYRL